MAIANAQRDVGSNGFLKSVTTARSKFLGNVGIAIEVDQSTGEYMAALESLVSKLDLFVQIVDKASKVSILSRSKAGPSLS